MDTKDYLLRYKECDRIASRCLEEYKAESEMIKSLRPYHKDFDADLISITQFTKNLKTQAEKVSKERDDILATLNGIPDLERGVLCSRYIEQMKWEDIAIRFSYSWHGIWKVHDRAIRMLQARIDEIENPLQT